MLLFSVYFCVLLFLKDVNSFGKAGLTEGDIEKFADNYIDRKIKEDSPSFLTAASEDADLFILTTGLDIGPKLLEEKYDLNLSGKISNKIIYNGSKIVSSKIFYNDKLSLHGNPESCMIFFT